VAPVLSKQEIRRRALASRQAQPDKDPLSLRIWRRLADLPRYVDARTVMSYVHVRSEVRTQDFLRAALARGRRIVVPYCVGGDLGLFLLADMDELSPGTIGIPEPRAELRGRPEKRVDAAELDLVVVPGVAFDRRGARLGYGRGYFDKLLARVRPDTLLVGLAFECQVFPAIPVEPHDVCMDLVITEENVYTGQGRRAA